MVYVISKNGTPLMPTKDHRKVRLLLKSGKAKVVRRVPFTIRIVGTSKTYKQEITLGVDAGSKNIGLSACTEKEELLAAELQPRNDVVELQAARREFRRARRNRKTRYRAPRFNNRVSRKHKGWLAPSVEVKIHNHVQAIRLVLKLLPVTKIRVETAEFDLHALKAAANGKAKPVGTEYQQGEMFGFYNTRQYVLFRDRYTCRVCGRKHGHDLKFLVTTAEGKETVSPEDSYTICEHCAKLYAGGRLPIKKRRHWTHPTFMGIMRKTLMQRLRTEFSIPVEETCGAITKMVREAAKLKKSHICDARCISEHPHAAACDTSYLIKPVRRHNRQLHKATILKGGYRKKNQAPKYVFGFRLFDAVALPSGKIGFVFGRRTSGYFDIRHLDWRRISAGISYKKLRLLEKAKNLLVETRQAS